MEELRRLRYTAIAISDSAPLPPEPYSGRGNVPTRLRLGEAKQQRPMSVKELAFEVDPSQWLSVEWREGTNFTLFGFAVEGIAGARAA